MKGFLKFTSGIGLGIVLGAIGYLVMTSEDEEGIVHDLKVFLKDVAKEGRSAAESRRKELEEELGIKLS